LNSGRTSLALKFSVPGGHVAIDGIQSDARAEFDFKLRNLVSFRDERMVRHVRAHAV